MHVRAATATWGLLILLVLLCFGGFRQSWAAITYHFLIAFIVLGSLRLGSFGCAITLWIIEEEINLHI